jgi:hypothetical protein
MGSHSFVASKPNNLYRIVTTLTFCSRTHFRLQPTENRVFIEHNSGIIHTH